MLDKRLDDILDTKAKVKIIRLFASKREDFMASGRDIARRIDLSAPATHAALKALDAAGVVKRNIMGRLHIYSLNIHNRLVQTILRPAFEKEGMLTADIKDFLIRKMKDCKVGSSIVSAFLYGSMIAGETHDESDCDLAIVVADSEEKKRIEKVFIERIAIDFSRYFGFSLDVYIKTRAEFMQRLEKSLPPIPSLKKSYMLVYGVDMLRDEER